MKNSITTLFTFLAFAYATSQTSEQPEFTGDNFSLEAALSVFKNSKNIEDFEKAINEENNNVNNLDLNNDGETDYITVEDVVEGNTHVIVLSTAINETEKQDIATIGIEKTGNDEATLQIIGDEELYAENTIVEPFDTEESMEKSKGGLSNFNIISTRVFINVWLWPSVRFVYAPAYRPWESPFHWALYPKWWKPWKVAHHHIFIKRNHIHRTHFHRTTIIRVTGARKVYAPRRHSSTRIIKKGKNTKAISKNKGGKGIHRRR